MVKRVLGLSVCLSLVAQLFVFSASAEQGATVVSSEINNGIATVVFSGAVNDSAKNEIVVRDGNGTDCTSKVSLDVDGDTLTADVSALPLSDAAYSMYLPEELGMENGAVVSITRSNEEVFSDDFASVSKWCSVGNYNTSMTIKPTTVPPDTVSGGIYVNRFVAPKTFASTSISNETMEFDYSYATIPGGSNGGFCAALLRCEDVYGSSSEWGALRVKGYALRITLAGGKVSAYLLGMEGDNIIYDFWITGEERMQAKSAPSIDPNTPVRFKVETKNTNAGVDITVYMAEYDGDVLGDYTQIMHAVDDKNLYTSGFFSFVGDASSGNIIDNVSVKTVNETISVREADPDPVTLKIEQYNLIYGENTYLMYAVSCEGDVNENAVRLEILNEDREVLYKVAPSDKQMIGGNPYLIFNSKGISAKKLGDSIIARASVTIDGKTYSSKAVSYSAYEYLKAALGDSKLSKYHDMFRALINYGAEAQKAFDYKTENIISVD